MKWYYAPDRHVWTGDRDTATGRVSTYEPVWIPCEIIRVGRKRVRIKPEYGYVEKWVYPQFVRDEDTRAYKLTANPATRVHGRGDGASVRYEYAYDCLRVRGNNCTI